MYTTYSRNSEKFYFSIQGITLFLSLFSFYLSGRKQKHRLVRLAPQLKKKKKVKERKEREKSEERKIEAQMVPTLSEPPWWEVLRQNSQGFISHPFHESDFFLSSLPPFMLRKRQVEKVFLKRMLKKMKSSKKNMLQGDKWEQRTFCERRTRSRK